MLAGVSVLEVGEVVAAPYAGRVLADLGADVLKVETRDGDPLRRCPPYASASGQTTGALFTYLNSGKQSVALDPGSDDACPAIAELIAGTDVLVVGDSRREIDRWSIDVREAR